MDKSALINVFILLFGGVQAILLAVVLCAKRAHRSANNILAVYLLALTIQIVCKVLDKMWILENIEWLYTLSYFLPLVYGPLIFLFASRLLRPKTEFGTGTLLQFAPFAGLFFLELFGVPGKFAIHFYSAASLISLATYHILALRMWRRYVNQSTDYYANVFFAQLQWLRQFVWVSFAVCSAITLGIYLIYTASPVLDQARWLFLFLTIFVYWVSAFAITQPEIFSTIRGEGGASRSTNINNHLQLIPKHKYARSPLNPDASQRILVTLQKIMAEKKPYLDPELTIELLAQQLSCHKHQLSQVLNAVLLQSFNDYINKYRIENAKELLAHRDYRNAKIISVAHDSGFNSISSFNDLFRKATGVTPSQFRKKAIAEADADISQKQIG